VSRLVIGLEGQALMDSSNSVMQKKKQSLRDKQIKLRASIEKRKKAKR